jgi:hypothetical protein
MSARWERLSASLALASIDATVTARQFPGGVSHSIAVRTNSAFVVVRDTWWHEMWTGWEVCMEDAKSGLSTVLGSRIKKRSQVVALVSTALEMRASA